MEIRDGLRHVSQSVLVYADIEVEGDKTDTDSDISDEAEIEAEESGDSEGTAVFSDDTEVGGGSSI